MPFVLLMAGIVACSTSIIWIKKSTVDPVLLTGLRLAIATIALAPVAYFDWRRHRERLNWTHLRDSAVPGLVLALHFITWILGARMTISTNGSLIVNLTPIATPFFLAALMGERVTKREVFATMIAMLGLAVLFASDYHVSPETLGGDLVCLGSMTLFALYLALGRKFRHHPTVWLYVVPMYAAASGVAFVLAPWLADHSPIDWRAQAPWVLALGLIPTVLGHSLLLTAMRYIRGQVVSVLNMLQFIPAGLIGWAALSERPNTAFYLAALLVCLAGVIAAHNAEAEDRTARLHGELDAK